MSNLIPADDPRANNKTYVAVCRTCGGWQYLGSAETEHAEIKRDVKRAAASAIEHGADFRLMRFGDVNLDMCECRRARP